MRRRRPGAARASRRSTLAGRAVVAAGLGLVVSALTPGVSAAQGDTPARVELSGTGAWTVVNQMNGWKIPLYTSPQAMDLSYLAKGDRDGRQIFARGEADFVISGVPLTDEDQATLAARGVEVVSAPISVASLAFLVSGPFPTGLRTFTPDPLDPEGEGTFAPYAGPLRIPNTTMARVFLDRGANNWYDPAFVQALAPLLPAGATLAPVINPTLPVLRSDPSAENYYVQRYVRQFAPSEYLAKVAEAQLPAFEPGESWPFLTTPSRSGSVNTASLVAGWLNPMANVVPYGGVTTATPLSEAIAQKASHPSTPLWIAEVQNGAGEWVAPSAASITKAAQDGGGAPLFGLTENSPGAYPLTWINRVYLPASGLSVDQTNGLATFLRFAVTVGQDASDAVGEGRLPEALVAETLAVADRLIDRNCTGAGRSVVAAADGGPLWPTGAAMPVGTFKVCRAAGSPSAPTTTTSPLRSPTTTVAALDVAGAAPRAASAPAAARAAVSGSTPGVGSPSSGEHAPLDPAVGDPSSMAGDGPSIATDGTGTAVPAALTAAVLPLGLPDDGRGDLDRLTTMVVGAALMVVGRSATRRSRSLA